MKCKIWVISFLPLILFSFSIHGRMIKCIGVNGAVSYSTSLCQGDQGQKEIQRPPDNKEIPLEQSNSVNIRQSGATVDNVVDSNPLPNNVCNCKGYAGLGGPCYAGAGGPAYRGPGGPAYRGPAYRGPGGPAYRGPGGPCYSGPGGSQYAGEGGPGYSGPGGPRYSGPGGPEYSGPGGSAYRGPGGPCYAGSGGPCYAGLGGSGANCPSVCK